MQISGATLQTPASSGSQREGFRVVHLLRSWWRAVFGDSPPHSPRCVQSCARVQSGLRIDGAALASTLREQLPCDPTVQAIQVPVPTVPLFLTRSIQAAAAATTQGGQPTGKMSIIEPIWWLLLRRRGLPHTHGTRHRPRGPGEVRSTGAEFTRLSPLLAKAPKRDRARRRHQTLSTQAVIGHRIGTKSGLQKFSADASAGGAHVGDTEHLD